MAFQSNNWEIILFDSTYNSYKFYIKYLTEKLYVGRRECQKIGRNWRAFYSWKKESTVGKTELCMAFSWGHSWVWTTWVTQYSNRQQQYFCLKCQSLGRPKQLEIKEGNPGKDFQQEKSPNLCLNSFQILAWTLSCMCYGDTSAPRRKG